MHADAAGPSVRGAALRSLPTASTAFIPLQDSSTSTTTTTATTTTASSAQLLERARRLQLHTTRSADAHVQPSSVATSASSPAVSSVVESTPRSRLSQWARRREDEKSRAGRGELPVSVAKLLGQASTSTGLDSGESTRSEGREWATHVMPRATGVHREVGQSSPMGMTPSALREDHDDDDDDADDDVEVEESRTPLGTATAAAAQAPVVPTAHLSLVRALASEVDEADVSVTLSSTAEPHARLHRGARLGQPAPQPHRGEVDEEDSHDEAFTEETSEGPESDVAERVLSTLHAKDALIASLSTALSTSEAACRTLREERAHWQAEAQRGAQEAAQARATIQITMTPPPSPSVEAAVAAPPPHALAGALSPGAHAALVTQLADADARANQLEAAVTAKETALQRLREDLNEAQQGWELQQVSVRAAQEHIRALEQRGRQLQQQLEETQGDKREDVATLRAHITQLQGQLDDRVREIKEKDKTHKRELAGLHKEMEALTAQFDAQMPTLAKTSALQESLAQAQREAQQTREALERAQQVGQEERQSAQARLAAEKQEKAAQAHQVASLTREREALRIAVDDAEHELSATRQDLTELRAAHARVHEEVTALRLSLQRQSSVAAESTLASAKTAAREREQQQRIVALEASLQSAQDLVQAGEKELEALRTAATRQVELLVAADTAKQAEVAEHVRGCALSTEKMEEAVVQAEARRRTAEAQLCRAQDEVRVFKELADRAAVQAQKDVLEYQELATTMTAFHREKLAEACAALKTLEATHASTDGDLRHTQHECAQLRTALEATMDTLDGVQREKSQLTEAVAAHRAALVSSQGQLKKALKAQLALTESKVALKRRLDKLVQARREQARREQHALVAQQDVWDVVGELATLLHTAEPVDAPEASLPLKRKSQQPPPQPHAHRPLSKPASLAVRAGGAADTTISLDELIQRTQALRWWCVAQQEHAAHAEQTASEEEEEEEEEIEEIEEEEERSHHSAGADVRTATQGCDTPPDSRARTKSPMTAATPVLSSANTSFTCSSSSVVAAVEVDRRASSSSRRPATRSKTRSTKARRAKAKQQAARASPRASPAALMALPMPPLVEALRALSGPLQSLHRQRQLCQRQLDASLAHVAALQNDKARAASEVTRLVHEGRCEKEAACEQLREALYRSDVDHNKALAALEARYERELDERVHDVARRSQQATLASETAEKRVRFDRCARIAEELLDFVARMPEVLEHYRTVHTTVRPVVVATKTAMATVVEDEAAYPPAGETLQPPRDDIRGLCDDISRSLLGLEGGWQDLAALCARQDSSGQEDANSDLTTSLHNNPHNSRAVEAVEQTAAPLSEWAWPPAMLADVEDALLQYLATRLHCAPSAMAPPRTHAPVMGTHGQSALPLSPPQSLANGIRVWVDSLRAGHSSSKAERDGRRRDVQKGQDVAAETSSSDLMMSNLLSACLEYAVDHLSE